MTDTVSVPVSIPVEKLVRVYLKMKDAHSALLHDFQEKEGTLKEQMDKVKAALLSYCKEHNVESVKTTEGLFYRTVSKKYWTSEGESMGKFVIEHNAPELLETQVRPIAHLRSGTRCVVFPRQASYQRGPDDS